MILVDTSIWIEFFRKSSRVVITEEMIPNLAVCPPVVQEVLQGIRDDSAHARVYRSLVSFHIVGEVLQTDTYIKASNIYRSARRKGITIRSSMDCLIAAIALENQVSIWHQDRDFHEIAKFTDLRCFK